mmetsp:Transcript_39667/g.79279  ORF Transcript_39667/g.79279 Transcript_39667/m.79279 type:complete len:215 (+) Transcript_39667:701-1345(+)
MGPSEGAKLLLLGIPPLGAPLVTPSLATISLATQLLAKPSLVTPSLVTLVLALFAGGSTAKLASDASRSGASSSFSTETLAGAFTHSGTPSPAPDASTSVLPPTTAFLPGGFKLDCTSTRANGGSVPRESAVLAIGLSTSCGGGVEGEGEGDSKGKCEGGGAGARGFREEVQPSALAASTAMLATTAMAAAFPRRSSSCPNPSMMVAPASFHLC